MVPTLQPKRLAKLVQRSTLVKHLFWLFGVQLSFNFWSLLLFFLFSWWSSAPKILPKKQKLIEPGPTQPLNLWMLSFQVPEFCSQNKVRNMRIVLVPRCQNATCCVAIALQPQLVDPRMGCRNVHAPPHLIPTAWVTCRAKGWRTSEHNTTAKINKMILWKIYIFRNIYFISTSWYFLSWLESVSAKQCLKPLLWDLTHWNWHFIYIIVRHYLTTWPWKLGRRQHVSHEKCSPQLHK